MKERNLWQYKEPHPPDDPYIIETLMGNDTTFSNGFAYASLVSRNYGYNDTSFGLKYERQIDNKVFQYFPNQQKEYLLYDFSKNIDDTVAFYPSPKEPGDTNLITVLDKGIQNIFEVPRNYITFYNRFKHYTMYWIEQITDSIGINFHK